MTITHVRARQLRAKSRFRRAFASLGLLTFFLAANSGTTADVSLSEYQVKALFLFNFAKYVSWPADAFPTATTPFTIGYLGQDTLKDDLKRAVEGKSVNARPIVIKRVTTDADVAGCHILFISSSESAWLNDILNKTSGMPILTVGEHDRSSPRRAIINFILVEKKVHLEIDLEAARQTRLQISSKLLGVADVLVR